MKKKKKTSPKVRTKFFVLSKEDRATLESVDAKYRAFYLTPQRFANKFDASEPSPICPGFRRKNANTKLQS